MKSLFSVAQGAKASTTLRNLEFEGKNVSVNETE